MFTSILAIVTAVVGLAVIIAGVWGAVVLMTQKADTPVPLRYYAVVIATIGIGVGLLGWSATLKRCTQEPQQKKRKGRIRPVGLFGLVSSLSDPGGNATGVNLLMNELVAKQIDVLHEAVPSAAVIGFLVNPINPNTAPDTKDAQVATEGASDALGMSVSLRSRPNLRTAAIRRGVPKAAMSNRSKQRSYSITSSAMASNPGGIVRPSDLETLRLISSSNLADCTTGSSAGRAPPKILPL